MPLLDREAVIRGIRFGLVPGLDGRIGNAVEEDRRRNMNTACPAKSCEKFQVISDLFLVIISG